ncbi:MAG: LamG domain-containing protein [Candidatus Poribacteria bacterium]|nr:LamG domain-containing protein [Candidatus Poribacteria bacterium]
MKKLMLLLTFTVVGFMLIANASAKTIVTDGLVSYWTFDRTNIKDRTVEDVWGENNATIVGNPKIAGGYLKQGLELDGVGDYVSLPNVGNFGSRIGPYTFEAWFKTSYKKRWSAIYKVNEWPCRINNSGYGILINAAWARGVADHILETKEDSIMIERNEKTGGGCAGGSSVRELAISDSVWHHIVYTTRKPTQEELAKLRHLHGKENCLTSYVYIDNEPFWWSVSCTSLNDIRPYTQPIFLGAVNHNGKASGFFQGVFDEVRIYDRALTHEEVIRNYESGIGLSVEPAQKLPTVWGALKAKR